MDKNLKYSIDIAYVIDKYAGGISTVVTQMELINGVIHFGMYIDGYYGWATFPFDATTTDFIHKFEYWFLKALDEVIQERFYYTTCFR